MRMRVTMISVLSLLVLSQWTSAIENGPLAFSDEMVDYINSRPDVTWRAARSKRFTNLNEFRTFLGAIREPRDVRLSSRPTIEHVPETNEALPKEFDAREMWPKCETIGHIWDQSSCGSCWAFGAVGAMSDRVCIHSGQTKTNVRLSTTDLLACCKRCGYGCEGGFLGPAWDYWRASGLVTGGDYGENGTCKPYPFPPCNHGGTGPSKYPDCPEDLYDTPRCQRRCVPESKLNYKRDKIRAKSAYNVPEDEEAIKREIYENGPVEAAFDVYADFGNYEEGVYQHVTGEMLGGHAIRIIGWGETEDGVPYWLIANSWNEEWAEKGFFRILRGRNECGIEAEVVAGIPKF